MKGAGSDYRLDRNALNMMRGPGALEISTAPGPGTV